MRTGKVTTTGLRPAGASPAPNACGDGNRGADESMKP